MEGIVKVKVVKKSDLPNTFWVTDKEPTEIGDYVIKWRHKLGCLYHSVVNFNDIQNWKEGREILGWHLLPPLKEKQ